MTDRARPLAGLLAAASVTGGLCVFGRALPPAIRAPWERRNHAGAPVTLLEGPSYAVGAAAGALLGGGASGRGSALAVLGSAAAGALDDLRGDANAKGLKGHLGALAHGQVTTGAVKILGITAASLIGSRVTDRHTGHGWPTTVLGAVTTAAAANFGNLLDLRPGRTLKVTVIAAVPLLAAERSRGVALAAVGAAITALPDDLSARSMLGDTGANAAGAAIGSAVVAATGPRGRFLAAAVLTGLTLASERVSFSAVIDRTPWLRAIDQWGRGRS